LPINLSDLLLNGYCRGCYEALEIEAIAFDAEAVIIASADTELPEQPLGG